MPSSASLLELKAITAEHTDRFAKEGKTAVKGQPRQLQQDKDPFNRPSPGLVKRLAAEARNDAKRRVFDDDGGPSDEQRREILRAKARKYDALRRGNLSGFTEKELAELPIDYEQKMEEDWSGHSSDEDESAQPEDSGIVEYIDELGRTRTGTRKQAREAQDAQVAKPSAPESSAYAEVMQSKIIRGDQNFFPVYEPDTDALKAKYRQAEEEARAHHYDASKEVRQKGAGQYQFSLDEEKRAEQMAALKSQRTETERARNEASQRGGLSKAQDGQKRKLEARRAVIEAKREKMFGGRDKLEQARADKRAAEAERFLQGLEKELI